MDLIEAEDIKKKWQEFTELYKKDLHDPDNYDDVITHLEPDILECEASLWTKLVEVTEFQLSYFKSWKMMLWKCCTQYASKFGKLSSGHSTGKGQFSFQSQRKAMPKNAQTTAQLHSSHMLVFVFGYLLFISLNFSLVFLYHRPVFKCNKFFDMPSFTEWNSPHPECGLDLRTHF